MVKFLQVDASYRKRPKREGNQEKSHFINKGKSC